MKKSIARLVSKHLSKDANKAAISRKTIIGALPLPKELRK